MATVCKMVSGTRKRMPVRSSTRPGSRPGGECGSGISRTCPYGGDRGAPRSSSASRTRETRRSPNVNAASICLSPLASSPNREFFLLRFASWAHATCPLRIPPSLSPKGEGGGSECFPVPLAEAAPSHACYPKTYNAHVYVKLSRFARIRRAGRPSLLFIWHKYQGAPRAHARWLE